MATAELPTKTEEVEKTIDQEVSEAVQLKNLLEKVLENTGSVVHDNGPNANLFDTAKFNQCYRVAKSMSQMSILPDHLVHEKGDKKRARLSPQQITANCFRIVNQAVRWGMDPYAIVDETYVVGGKLGYQGKLVAAVVNARAGLIGRLKYEHKGEGANRTVIVSGRFEDDPDEICQVELKLSDAKTDNMMWTKDPDQKLCYSGSIKWARRHCPEVVLGVLTDDDLDRMNDRREVQVNDLHDLTEFMSKSKPKGFKDHVGPVDDEPEVKPEPEPEPESESSKDETADDSDQVFLEFKSTMNRTRSASGASKVLEDYKALMPESWHPSLDTEFQDHMEKISKPAES